MKKFTWLLPIATLLCALFSTNVSAVVIDFIALTEDEKPGDLEDGLGESSWSELTASDHPYLNYFGINITGHATNDDDDDQFAYLDWNNAGLGVCKDTNVAGGGESGSNTGSGSNSCAPSSDDNVTDSEWLEFVFDTDVIVNNLWFNNNHDATGIDGDAGENPGDDKVDITDSVGLGTYALMDGSDTSINGIGSFLVKQGDALKVAFNNEQFYVSAMEVSAVPVPAAVWLFGTALLGFVGLGRRTNVA